MSDERETLCPSAPADWPGARVIGVAGGSADAPEVAYLDRPLPLDDALAASTSPAAPDEVFRIAAPCACSGCGHFSAGESKCQLARKIVRLAPIVVEKLPPCSIRSDCRWWKQEGRAACQRCPQVVAVNARASEEVRSASDPLLR